MNKNIENFHNLIDKYQLTDETPADVKNNISQYKKAGFKNIIKKAGKYSIISAAVYSVFFFLKKLGISISVFKSIIIVSVGSIVIVSSVSTGVYYTIKHITGKDQKLEKKIDNTQLKNKNIEALKNNPQNKTTAVTTKDATVAFGVIPFAVENAPKTISTAFTSGLISNLKAAHGSKAVMRLNIAKQNRVKKLVIGSIDRIDGSYIITAKVVRVKDSKILKMVTETVDSKDKLQAAAKRISAKVK